LKEKQEQDVIAILTADRWKKNKELTVVGCQLTVEKNAKNKRQTLCSCIILTSDY
jgi:hypothetical protein